jgi:hypothetical protein
MTEGELNTREKAHKINRDRVQKFVSGDDSLWCKPPIEGSHTASVFPDSVFLSIQGLIEKIFSESV